MAELWWKVLVSVILVGALVSVPFGVPGVWVMIIALFGAVLAGWVGWWVWATLTVLALLSEILEFVVVRRMGDRYGGGPASFWAAILGGFVGVLVGMPIPLVGPVLAGLLGTFAGAAVVTLHRTRSPRQASRVGWGVLLARILAVGLKVGVGILILLIGIGSFAFG